MYTLYYSPGAASFAVHWLLIEIGAPHELKKIDLDAGEQRSPEYLKLNPNGVVPTLIVDGSPLYECAALLMLLTERHPHEAFAPAPGSPQRGAYLTWMFHLANTVQTAAGDWFHPDRVAEAGVVEAVRAGAHARLVAAWDRIETQLGAGGPYLVGDRVRAVDFFATMLMRWSRNMPKPATEWPGIADYVKRMKARPTFKVLYEREGLTEWV